jgi:hypothetical protein
LVSLTLKDEFRLRVFGNRLLRRTFGPKRKEVAGGWRRLHNEELHNLFTSPNIKVIKSRNEMHGTCSTHEMRDAYNIFVGKPEGKSLLRRPSRRW